MPWSAFVANSQIEFELILPGSGPNGWYSGNPAKQVRFELQSTGGAQGTVNVYPAAIVDMSAKDQVIHVVTPYDPGALDPTATGWNLSLLDIVPEYAWEWDAANPSVIPFAARFYVDNIQLNVPEPASLVVLAAVAGASGLRRRRRRHA